MAMSAEKEKLIAELHAGVKAASANDVANERSQLQQVLDAIDSLKGAKPLTAEQNKAVEEVRSNIQSGASVVGNSRATLLTVFECLASLKAEPAKSPKSEPKV